MELFTTATRPSPLAKSASSMAFSKPTLAASASAAPVAPTASRQSRPQSKWFCDRGTWGRYVGDLSNGLRHGYGKMTWTNDRSYDGQWKQDRRHGWGMWRHERVGVYRGWWSNGHRHGMGTFRYANGDMYEGTWKQGKEDGRGTLVLNGDRHTCVYKLGRATGGGLIHRRDGWVDVVRYGDQGELAGEGVRWSADRRQAWLLADGEVVREIGPTEADLMASRMGFLHCQIHRHLNESTERLGLSGSKEWDPISETITHLKMRLDRFHSSLRKFGSLRNVTDQ